MLLSSPHRWAVRGATFALWALAAASVAYWALRLATPAPAAPAAAADARGAAPADPAAIVRLLGSAPVTGAIAAPSLASRFSLIGVVAGRDSGGGAALISVDGKPAKPYRVGAAIDDNLVLQSVEGRRARIGPTNGAPALTLELPQRR